MVDPTQVTGLPSDKPNITGKQLTALSLYFVVNLLACAEGGGSVA